MSTTRFFNSNVFQRFFKNRKEPLIESRAPVGKLNPDIVSIVRDWVDEDCLITLDDISHRLGKQYGISIGQDKITCCFNSLHFSVERVPVNCPFKVNQEALLLLRKVFADDFLKYSNRVNLFFIGTTKVTINTRVYQGKKASPQWAVKSKTFTISVALRPDKVFFHEIQDSSYNHKETPNNSPDKPQAPMKFSHFFKKFTEKLEADGIRGANIIMDGKCYYHVLQEDADLLQSRQLQHKIAILPGETPEFNPLETLFDSLRYHIEKFKPIDPESVFAALKKLPESVTEIDCSYYFSDSLNHIESWSEMHF